MSAPNELPSDQAQQATACNKQTRKRGTEMTAANWAAQFSADMEVYNNCAKMWCKHCGVLVQHDDKNFAMKHMKGSFHKRLKRKGKAVNFVQALAALRREQHGAALLEQQGTIASFAIAPRKQETASI